MPTGTPVDPSWSNTEFFDGAAATSFGSAINATIGDVTALEGSRVNRTTLTAKGDLFVATASGVITRLPAGPDGQVLTTDSTQTSGLKYAAPSSTVGGVTFSGTGATGQVATLTSPTTANWQNPTGGGGSGYTDPLTTAGDIVVRGASTTIRKAVGTNLQLLQVNTANADKLAWVDPSTLPVSTAQAAADANVAAQARAFSFALSLLLRN